MFQHHRIARKQRRANAVERGEEGIVPGRDRIDDPFGHALDVELKSGSVGSDRPVLQRGFSQIGNAFQFGNPAFKFSLSVAQGLEHFLRHPGGVGVQVFFNGGQRVQIKLPPFPEGQLLPALLGRLGAPDLGVGGSKRFQGISGNHRSFIRVDQLI